MSYKAFQDFYLEEPIKHLLLHEHNGMLLSPPFATEQCKDYSKVLCFKDGKQWTIDLELPPVTSKFNSMVSINDSVWFIPYGIWDNFNIVVQLKDLTPIYHKIDMPGKGQFYSTATNGITAFSFPLGYEDTSYGLFIENESVSLIPFDRQNHVKLHMGSVYCNGRYWSAPRSDTPGYVNLVSFDGHKLVNYPITVKDPTVTRKYTDIIVKDNILYSLPFGETSGMTEVIEFNTITNEYKLYDLDIPDFAKKFNAGVLVDDVIIALPYGDENADNSNLGLIYNTHTHEYKTFDIGLNWGGKYRFRCGVASKGCAVFLPGGTPTCPVLVIDKQGNILKREMHDGYMLGRPIVYNDSVVAMSYNMQTKEHKLITIDW
jgi:hypothetical protein